MEKIPILRLNTYKTEEQINEIKNKISKFIPQPVEPVKPKEKSSKVITPKPVNEKIIEKPIKKTGIVSWYKKNKATKILNVFSEQYPKTFPYKPLAIGIKNELFAISEELGFSKTELKIFLTFYCRSNKYRANLILNAERVNLKGEITGLVKEQEAVKPKI